MYKKIARKFNNISFSIILSLCAIIPVIFLPSNIIGLDTVKGVIIYAAVFLAISFWLVSQFVEGTLSIPKSPAFLALGSWVILSLIGALTSINPALALWGRSFVFDSFSTNLVISLFIFIVATFARDQRKLVKIFLATFIASSVTVLLQYVLFLSKKLPFVYTYLGNISTQGTLVGSWVDFTYFITFVFILALLMYEVLVPKGIFKMFSFLTMIISLFGLIFLNFKAAWIMIIISALLVFVYKSSVERALGSRLSILEDKDEKTDDDVDKQRFPIMSFVSLLIGLLFFLGSNSIGISASKFAGISFTDVRPSFSMTNNIMRATIYHDPLFGIGAGNYNNAWNLYHSPKINTSIFWNVSFENGFSLIQSIITTNGLLPSIAFVIVLILALVHGFRLFNYTFPDRFTRFIAFTSLVMTITTVILIVFGSPSMVLIIFGFTYIGLLFGVSGLIGKTKLIHINFLKDPRLSFFAILILVVSSMVSFSAVYFTGIRFAGDIFYTKAINSSDSTIVKSYIDKAINLSNTDKYWKTRTVFYTQEFTKLATKENSDKEQMQNLFTKAEESAQKAISLNKLDSYSWLSLSQVYQLIVTSSSDEAFKSAEIAGLEAEKLNPSNPLFKINNARIKLLSKDIPASLEAINNAILLKPNYLDAYLLRGQINKSQGVENALRDEILKYISIQPTDPQAYVFLGNIYMETKNYNLAISSFNKAINLDPLNPNNYLLLISALDKSGDKTASIRELKEFQKKFPDISGVEEQINIMENSKEQSAIESVNPSE